MLNINKKGSTTIETALILPGLITIFFVFIFIMRVFLLYNCVSSAMYKIADNAFNNRILGLRPLFQENFTELLSEDETFQTLFEGKVSFDFTGTGYFYGNEELVFTCLCKYYVTLPFYSELYDSIDFRKTLTICTYSEGKNTILSEYNESSVWRMSDFQRGKKIEEVFGGNLPYYFPVADIYDGKNVTSVVSINHKSKSYENVLNLEKYMTEKIIELAEFKEAEYGNIKIENVENKEIIFVFPEDDFTEKQQNVIDKIIKSSWGENLTVKTERYQYI